MKPLPVPYLVRRLDGGAALEIHWDEAGHVGIYGARELRLACPCAACRDEISGAPILEAGGVPDEIRAVALRLVGAYAAHFAWSDGHDTGIYPWEYLLALCPCPRCAAERSGGGPWPSST
ncbi:MAG TPA: DUF971 domain-containing protein [Gemmatimonadales bacterium]|nr:DUF971 domain-containing protein [Gemmatimonadales bacterium]